MKAEKTSIIEEVLSDIIEPGIQRLLETPYFTELRSGKLSRRRIQAWALEHYLYNISIAKGQVICMFKYAHDPELYGAFAAKFAEEQIIRRLAERPDDSFPAGMREPLDVVDPAPANDDSPSSGWGSGSLPAFIAYDLSATPEAERQQVLQIQQLGFDRETSSQDLSSKIMRDSSRALGTPR